GDRLASFNAWGTALRRQPRLAAGGFLADAFPQRHRRLGEQCTYGLAVIRDGYRPVAVVEAFAGIDAEGRVNGGEDIGHADRVLNRAASQLVRDAIRAVVPQAAAGEDHAERLGVVAAPSAAIELRRP